MAQIFDKPARIPQRERWSSVWVSRGRIDVKNGAFVVIDKHGIREQIPIGAVSCLMLEPGTRISHAAVRVAAEVRCLLLWVGEGGVRVYSAGRPGGARADRLLWQAQCALQPEARLRVVRAMYRLRFGEEPPQKRSVDQLRGIEGARVRGMYSAIAKRHGLEWKRRKYDVDAWDAADRANRALSVATACLYGITEAAVLAAGYSPAIGFIHTGKPLSFVYDVADIVKFDQLVPMAFKVAASNEQDVDRKVRLQCRDIFRKENMLRKIIPMIDDVLNASEIPFRPHRAEGHIEPAIPDPPDAP